MGASMAEGRSYMTKHPLKRTCLVPHALFKGHPSINSFIAQMPQELSAQFSTETPSRVLASQGSYVGRSPSTVFLFVFCLFVFWLHWVFIAVRGLSLVAASGGYSSLQCTGFSLRWLLLLWSTGSRHTCFSSCGAQAQQLLHVGSVVVARGLQSAGLVVVVHGLSCSTACGIFLDQGLNPCPLHYQADS